MSILYASRYYYFVIYMYHKYHLQIYNSSFYFLYGIFLSKKVLKAMKLLICILNEKIYETFKCL